MANSLEEEGPTKNGKTYSKQDKSTYGQSPSGFNIRPDSFFSRPPNKPLPIFIKPIVKIGASSPVKTSSPASLTVGNLSENERIFNARIINYPEGAHVRDQLSINSSDLDCLDQYKMLNDNIVYLYLKYVDEFTVLECFFSKSMTNFLSFSYSLS